MKIEKAILKTQQVTPSYVDQLIGLYERKRTSQKDKVYILLELKRKLSLFYHDWRDYCCSTKSK